MATKPAGQLQRGDTITNLHRQMTVEHVDTVAGTTRVTYRYIGDDSRVVRATWATTPRHEVLLVATADPSVAQALLATTVGLPLDRVSADEAIDAAIYRRLSL